jgi:iron complex transport system substrate-binding protein
MPPASEPGVRVVSLLPGATEMVAALGVEPVGVSHECDHPPGVASLPTVNRCRIDPTGAPGAVDAAVSEAVEEGGVYEVDRERLAALDPDVVVTQAVCDVCAVDQVAVREAVADRGLDATVVAQDVHSVADLYAAIEELGSVLDREGTAATVVDWLRERLAAVRAAAGDPSAGPRVAVLDWPDPPMVAGHWIPELVAAGGGRYGMAAPGAASRPREWAAIREYDPEVLVIAPCGFPLAQTVEHLDTLQERPGWNHIAAVRDGAVYAMDGHHHVNRAGPRLVHTAAMLADVVSATPLEWTDSDGWSQPSGLVQQVEQ